MIAVESTVPIGAPPAWAVLERRLFDALDQSVDPFLEKYTRPDGSLIWREEFPGRDGADDFYESFYNWPLLYLLGGADRFLSLGIRQWEAITRQLTALGHVRDEYERGYDWFHQGEGNLYFYFLCLADPDRPEHRERARRFAGLYLNEDPDAPNYDPHLKLIRAPHTGRDGPRPGFTDGEPSYGWSAGMAVYGLPYDDVAGIASYDDLKDPINARRMGAAMQGRLGRGDVVTNLLATSLVTNAYLMTGEEKYRAWVVEYTDAWIERARQNGGLLPDNVGLSGRVGEYVDGKWYGGLYGWTWPHGFYNVAAAAIVAATNAYLLTRDRRYLDLPRTQIDRVAALGVVRDPRQEPMSLRQHWIGQFGALHDEREMFVVPYRHGDRGWFDFQPMNVVFPTTLWHLSLEAADWQRIERAREASRYDWRRVVPFRSKEDGGHEPPWLRFLAGDNPSYPEEVLRESLAQVSWRLDLIRADRADLTTVHIHHWQQLNPILTEGLIQLTLGAPAPIYNGGLLVAPLRYFDVERSRPGLPPDVAALVTRRDSEQTVVRLVNLSPVRPRELIIQAGTFREHRFVDVSYDALDAASSYPGDVGAYAPPAIRAATRTVAVRDTHLYVQLRPSTQIELRIGMEYAVNKPSYASDNNGSGPRWPRPPG